MWITPERVRQLRSMPYPEYLKTPEWRSKREDVFQARGRYCCICRSNRDLDIHHNTYARRGDESLDDLVVLCAECHAIFHAAGKMQPGEDLSGCEQERLSARFDPLDRSLAEILLVEPEVTGDAMRAVPLSLIKEEPVRIIIELCYDTHNEGPGGDLNVAVARLGDPFLRSLAADIALGLNLAPAVQASVAHLLPSPGARLSELISRYAIRAWEVRLRDLRAAMEEPNCLRGSNEHDALQLEYRRLLQERPDKRTWNQAKQP